MLRNEYDKTYSDYVCKDAFGKLITSNYVSAHFAYMIKKYNLKPIRFHVLRPSCASLLLANGVSMKEIQEWLGHSMLLPLTSIVIWILQLKLHQLM